ncbi:MAG: T9SS type A sorting domain-containing protein [Melioribacteraceae bacterium]
MLKKITLLLSVILITAGTINAQWFNAGPYPNGDAIWKAQNNSIAVDPDGKIWIGKYFNVPTTGFINPGTGKPLRTSCYLTYVFNPDGTQAPFSPIFQIMGDTMYSTTQRGMRTNIDGNIILTTGFPSMYIINYKTGIGIKRVLLPSTNGPTAPAVSANGIIFVGSVFEGQRPVEMYDQNLTLIGSAITKAPGFSRGFDVSKDGNTIYWAGYTLGKVLVYTRPDVFSSFALKDSMMIGAKVESFAWHPKTGYLWMSGGSNNDKPSPPYTMGTWYAYSFTQKKVVDSLKWTFTNPAAPDERPRAMAFSNDGRQAFIGQFGTSNSMVQVLVNLGTDVKPLAELPTGYDLSQNYPNPFNPTTNIKFSIPEQGFVSLKIYNTLGQEVATLLNEYKSAGTYQVDFNASKLSSGMYVYTLTSGKIHISKKMLLMK